MSAVDAAAEFDRQVELLVAKGCPGRTGRSATSLRRLLAPLREVGAAAGPMAEPTTDRVPFVLVLTRDLIAGPDAMGLTELGGRAGYADFDPADLRRFEPIKEIREPAGSAYLAFDVDRGAAYRNLTPDEAMLSIAALGRTPLTVEEGIALVTQQPQTLERNHCFSLAGSRCGDRRVPAIWISQRAPKLGWCWAGNPHPWLGTASAGDRSDAV